MNKVYCVDCRYYLHIAGRICLDDEECCKHPSNMRFRDTYLCRITEYIRACHVINKKNNCPNFVFFKNGDIK